ncbi:hypothetical protein KFK09_020977 [Dendrobium nobile]|uniref:Uncharacterized protein n=1 Tax=Dendrobium nobile TaxID=94219 RepID=A0A8T3AN56_DENNO|nr:hypothetical protein KFK09_020977 [Dendrobium nobile]
MARGGRASWSRGSGELWNFAESSVPKLSFGLVFNGNLGARSRQETRSSSSQDSRRDRGGMTGAAPIQRDSRHNSRLRRVRALYTGSLPSCLFRSLDNHIEVNSVVLTSRYDFTRNFGSLPASPPFRGKLREN